MELRLSSLWGIDLSSPVAPFGIGYVSSSGIEQVNAAANGKADMLIVSLFYRVGIVGIAAYILFVVAAMKAEGTMTTSARCLAVALLIAILVQSSAESYFSSVMSFVSCVDWIALSAFPLLIAREETECA